jgi:hypothetical protein
MAMKLGRCVLGAILVWGLLPLQAQAAEYPTKQEILGVLKDVDYAVRRFEEVSSRVNLRRWNAPAGFIEDYGALLATTRELARRMKIQIEVVESSNEVSASDLFKLYSPLGGIANLLKSLGNHAAQYGKDSLQEQEMELRRAALVAAKAELNFFDVLVKQLEAERLELHSCRTTRK